MKTINRIIFAILAIALMMSFGITANAAAIVDPSNIGKVQVNTARIMSEDYDVEEIDFIPLYNQRDYADVNYGTSNVYNSGCGLVSVWMIATYMNNEIYDINDLAEQFGDEYYVEGAGSIWSLFIGASEELGLGLIKSDAPNGEWYSWKMVVEALENDQPVVCLQKKGIFTRGGHYIVLTGITEDGKILVNDPNGDNWTKNAEMIEGFANGFSAKQIRAAATAYWIFGEKVEEVEEVEVIDEVVETETEAENVAEANETTKTSWKDAVSNFSRFGKFAKC